MYNRVLRNLVGCAHSDHLSLIKDIDAITDTRDEVQVVIDDDDTGLNESRYFSNPVNHLLRLEITHAARGFIKQQKSGASCGRPGKFETPRVPIVQFTGAPMSELCQATGTNQEFNVRQRAAGNVSGSC